jgi:hypothetical protein
LQAAQKDLRGEARENRQAGAHLAGTLERDDRAQPFDLAQGKLYESFPAACKRSRAGGGKSHSEEDYEWKRGNGTTFIRRGRGKAGNTISPALKKLGIDSREKCD